jgi:divalent metal cation (Fe/Co/Zn/Cd) transporter
VAPAVLLVAIVLEALSFRTAIKETNKIRGQASFATFVRRAKQPELPVILLEDLAALTGLTFALLGVTLTLVTGNQYFDVVGTALIGLLLVAVAVILAIETKSLLIGESASLEAQRRIEAELAGTDGVESIIHMKTLHLGPEELLVAAKIGVRPGASAEDVAATIDAAEEAIRAAEPIARVIYLEPDIRRPADPAAAGASAAPGV